MSKCPMCKREKHVTTYKDGRHFCHNCKVEFEDDDEGGDYFRDPTRRLEIQEQRAIEDRNRRQQPRRRA